MPLCQEMGNQIIPEGDHDTTSQSLSGDDAMKAMIDDITVSDLLEMFMESSGLVERWITVYEFRTRFQLDEDTAPIIAGFLRRLHHKTLFYCAYRVEKIEKIKVSIPQQRMIKSYLVQKRPAPLKDAEPDVKNQ